MDSRFKLYGSNSKRDDTQVVLHPTASIDDIRNGAATDAYDLSPFVTTCAQSFNETSVGLAWNYELFGPAYGGVQPAPNMVLELLAQGIPLWIGIIENISQYNIGRGKRSMEITAKSRDSFDIWRTSKRVTPPYNTGTSYQSILNGIATDVGLLPDEIISTGTISYSTLLPTIQLADMSAWEMLTTVGIACTLTPFMDGLGRLRFANRQVINRQPDLVLTDFVEMTASRTKSPATRIVLQWADPVPQNVQQIERKLGDATITFGWFGREVQKPIYFSPDQTQCALNTYLVIKQSANQYAWTNDGPLPPACKEFWTQDTPTGGTIALLSYYWTDVAAAFLVLQTVQNLLLNAGVDIATWESWSAVQLLTDIANVTMLILMMSIGTGIYEVWGTPYTIVNAINSSECYDNGAPPWVDNPVTLKNNFIRNEVHAQTIVQNELIYQASEANRTTAKIIENLNIEYGDLIQFPDGSTMFTVDIHRNLMRGSDNILEVNGFMLPGASSGLDAGSTETSSSSGGDGGS